MSFFFYLLFSIFCWDSTAGLVVLWKFIHSTESAKNTFSDKHNDKCDLYVIRSEVFHYFEASQNLLYCCVAVFEWLRMLGHCTRKIFITGLKVAPVLITERHISHSTFCPHSSSWNSLFRFLRVSFQKSWRTKPADNSWCRLWPSSLTSFIMEWKRAARPNNDGAQLNYMGQYLVTGLAMG